MLLNSELCGQWQVSTMSGFGDRYVCNNVKPLKTVCNYRAKICESVKKFVQHAYFCTF